MLLSVWVICLPGLSVFGESVTFMGEDLIYDNVYQQDLNANGKPELTFYMDGDSLVLSEWDLDENGTPERFYAFESDDTLSIEAYDDNGDGRPERYFRIDGDDNAKAVLFKEPLPYLWYGAGAVMLFLAVLSYMLVKKKRIKNAVSILLAISLILMNNSPAYGSNVLNKDCTINNEVFEQEWIKYSDIDERIGEQSRSFEAQNVQSIADELRFHYEGLSLAERDLELERMKRMDLKEIKSLLVRNIKNNLLKAFMRLSYVTYDTIKGAYGNRGSIETILDKSSGGAQIITSYIKMRASLNLPSKTEAQKKDVYDRVKGLANSNLLEYFDVAGDPKKLAANLVNDLQKEAFDIAKTEDNWDDANLSEADFQLMKNQYTRNRDFDVGIQESYLLSSELRVLRDQHLEAIKALEAEYRLGMASEKDRVRAMLIEGCKNQPESTEPVAEPQETAEPPEPGATDDILAGSWSGFMQIQKINQPEKYSPNEQAAILKQKQPMKFTITAVGDGIYTVTDITGAQTPMTVAGREITIVFKQPIPNGNGTMYQNLNGIQSPDGTQITGSFSMGMDQEGEGEIFSGVWQAARQ